MQYNIAFYISGHGYGHSIRAIEIIKMLLAMRDNTFVHIRTGAPQWLFADVLGERCQHHAVHLDVGAVQQNSFSVDKKATLQQYASLISRYSSLLETEKNFLVGRNINIVASDITPLAFDAAKEAGIPAIAIGNFSWDWIYGAWMDEYKEFSFVVQHIRRSYQKANLLLRLPFYGDMSVFPRIKDISLIGRKAERSGANVREKLGFHVQGDRKLVLLGMRYDDLKLVRWPTVTRSSRFWFLTNKAEIRGENIRHFQEGDVPFQDIVNACDAVLSKPGYSIIAECITNRTPMLYIPRDDFVEDSVLRKGLEEFAVCEKMPIEEYEKGQWQAYLDRLFAKPNHWPEIKTDGAMVAAQEILHTAGRATRDE